MNMSDVKKPLVTVITATTGNPLLARNIKSVHNQTYDHVQHLVVIDGQEYKHKVWDIIDNEHLGSSNLDVIELPYSTGKDRYNGHRIYGASTYLADGDFLIFLDDDNYINPTHVQDCINVIKAGNAWAYSLRHITEGDKFVCNDDCESLGKWESICGANDFFIDVNCYFLPRNIALAISPVWFRKFREPGQMEIDRAMMYILRNQIKAQFDCTYGYTVGYNVGNSPLSVQKDFFLQGNVQMNIKHQGVLPWRK